MAFVQEFKSFAVKGNVMDLAIGVIIGGAFGKIVDTEPPANSEPVAPVTPEDVLLLREIRDSLKTSQI